jgi:hypothetical protein
VTTYFVLRKIVDDSAFEDGHYNFAGCGSLEAHGALAALRKAGEQWGAGTYVAVPQSNWTEERVGVETTTRITVGGSTQPEEPPA